MIKYFKKMALASLITGVLCCGFWTFSSSAEACCIYNHTIHPLVAQSAMFSSMTIHPSNHRCTDGTGGRYLIWLQDAFESNDITKSVSIEVDKHGWISVYKKSGGKWKVVSKRKDGSIKEVKHLVPGADFVNDERQE